MLLISCKAYLFLQKFDRIISYNPLEASHLSYKNFIVGSHTPTLEEKMKISSQAIIKTPDKNLFYMPNLTA